MELDFSGMDDESLVGINDTDEVDNILRDIDANGVKSKNVFQNVAKLAVKKCSLLMLEN